MQIPLLKGDVERRQKIALLLRFDPFRNDNQPEVLHRAGNAFQDRALRWVFGDFVKQGFIELHGVDRIIQQTVKVAGSCPKIIQGDDKSRVMQLVQFVDQNTLIH